MTTSKPYTYFCSKCAEEVDVEDVEGKGHFAYIQKGKQFCNGEVLRYFNMNVKETSNE